MRVRVRIYLSVQGDGPLCRAQGKNDRRSRATQTPDGSQAATHRPRRLAVLLLLFFSTARENSLMLLMIGNRYRSGRIILTCDKYNNQFQNYWEIQRTFKKVEYFY